MTEWLALGITTGVAGGAWTYYKYYRAQKKQTAEYLNAAKEEKDLLNFDLDALIAIKEKALLLVGSFGGSDRSYEGETLEMAQRIEALMEENFLRSAELAAKVDEVEDIIQSDRDKVLSKEDASKVAWVSEHRLSRYRNFSMLKRRGEKDRASLRSDLDYLENLLETLWVKLDEQDERFKSILLRQVELTKKSKSGRFQLNKLGRSWARETEELLDNAFAISKNDPVRVDQSLLGHLVQRFDRAEAALEVAEKLIEIENREVRTIRKRMDSQNLEELWVSDGLDEMDKKFRDLVGYSDSVRGKEKQIGRMGFTERLYEMDFMLVRYESHHRHLNEKLERLLGKVRRQIAEHLDIDESEVLQDSEELALCKLEAQEVLADLGEAISNGNVERSRSLHELLKDKFSATHDALAAARRSAIEGEERVKLLRAGLVTTREAMVQAMQKHRVLLESNAEAVFDDDYLIAVKGAEHQLDVLDVQLDLIERHRAEGKFLVTEKIMNSAEITLQGIREIPERVEKSERDVQKLEAKVETMLDKIDSRLGEILSDRDEAFLCKETKQMIQSVEVSYATFLEVNSVKGRERNVLNVTQCCHKLDDLLEVVSLCIDSDADLFKILNQKVEQIDALVAEAKENAKTAVTDGIPDSQLTTQMLEKVEFLTARWPKLRTRLDGHQIEWRELRFDFDVFLQGLEAVNLQLEDELKYAKQTLDTLEEVSLELKKLSAWQGERGYRAETRKANQLLHSAFQKLSLGEYNETNHLAQQARDEMRDSLHDARRKERVAELRNARIQSRVLGAGTETNYARSRRAVELNPIRREEN